MKSVSTTSTRSRLTRAISRTAAATSAKWCAASLHATTSKLRSGKGSSSARQTTSGRIAGDGSQLDDLEARFPEPPRDVAPARRDVERSACAERPLDDEVEIRALAVSLALAVDLGALVPDRAHPASSTTRRGCIEHGRLGVDVRRRGLGEEPPALVRLRAVEADDDRHRDRHPLERLEQAARDLSASRDAAEDVEEDRLDRVGRDDLERATTISSACAPPPTSQKFAGRPPACATTSSVDMTSPAPFPRMPMSPSSLT